MASNKEFYQPVKPFILNQGFGENQACVDIETGSKTIVCNGNNPPKGYRSLYGAGGHKGIDLRAKHGQPVYAAAAGVVEAIDTNPKTGLDVKIVSEIGGEKYMHVYEHLLGYDMKVGETVATGDLVGWADNTGYSAGDHLHFELKIWKKTKWVSIDPLPLMNNQFALDVVTLIRLLKELVALLTEKVAEQMRKRKNG